jgi:CMP-2-keto-3-deoxyoctulosonic acid synthetase
MKVIVGIQARMGSQRLPGKVLMDLCGQPLIRRVWDAVEGPWERVVLTSLKEENDILCSYMDDAGLSYMRGSEGDVLSRYQNVVVSEPKDTILVRVCADAPFLEAWWIDLALSKNGAFVPGALHIGTPAQWLSVPRTDENMEHAGSPWFEANVPHLDLIPHDYIMVNTQADLDEARRRWPK